jgi:uncharacterized protein (TIGR02284 family)
MKSDTLEQLKSLHTASIDARNGYREAVKDAHRGKDLISLFQQMSELHDNNATDIQKILVREGERESESGSFMSSVHRTIMDIRAIFGGLDKSVLPGLIDGERRNVSHYDEALAVAGGDSEAISVLRASGANLWPQSRTWSL